VLAGGVMGVINMRVCSSALHFIEIIRFDYITIDMWVIAGEFMPYQTFTRYRAQFVQRFTIIAAALSTGNLSPV
jgi:hypothetical protein